MWSLVNSPKCRQQDGGTRVVPGFHRCFMQWLEALGLWAMWNLTLVLKHPEKPWKNIRKTSNNIWPLEDFFWGDGRWGDMESNLAQSGQHDNWVLRRAAGGGSFKFSNLDPIHQLSRLGQWTQRFPRSITRIIRGRHGQTNLYYNLQGGGSGYRFLIIMSWLILLSCLRMRITNQQDGRYMIGCSWRFVRKNLAKRNARPPKVVEPTLQSSKHLKDMFVLINHDSSFFIRTPSLFPLPLSLYRITQFLMAGESQWGLAAFFFGINSWFMAAVPIAAPIFAWLNSSPAFAPVRWAHRDLGLER